MTTIKVTGMSCQHCVQSVTKALNEIEGVHDVQVSLENGEAEFTETQPVPLEIIRENLKKAGHDLG